MKKHLAGSRGFTLIELIIIIVVLGILAAVAIPKMGDLASSSRVNATKSEMIMLKRAIIGNPQVVSGGRYVDVGFEGDVGRPPTSLIDLAVKPDSIAMFDKFTRLGWNGPYVDSASGDFLQDAWDQPYLYNPNARTITSTGGSETITISF